MDRDKMGIKSCKFIVLFVVGPIIAVLCSTVTHAEKTPSSNRTKGLQQGLIYVKLNRYSESIAEFKKELENNPDNTDAYFHLGNSYFKLREYDNVKDIITYEHMLGTGFSYSGVVFDAATTPERGFA